MSQLEDSIVKKAAELIVDAFSKYNSEGTKIDKSVIKFVEI